MMHTKDSLQRNLHDMGILEQDTLLVHSSLKSIGETEGRGEGVVQALTEYFSGAGLLVMPTLTYDRKGSGDPVFDVLNTPSIVGTLTNLFRRCPGVIRSWHPTHSVAASGRDAAAFTAGHEKFDSPAPRNSPWGRLIDRKAKILFIGCSIGSNTFLHGIEEQNNVPGCLTELPDPLFIITPEGKKLSAPTRRHVGHHSNHYGKMYCIFERMHLLKTGRFGDARCTLLDTAGVAELVSELLKQDPFLFTHDRAPETYLNV